MKSSIISNKTLWFITYILLSFNPIHAQYYGGDGDGNVKNSSIQLTLNGMQINPLALYLGGNGDGQDKRMIQVSLNGDKMADLYKGGAGDGNGKLNFFTTLGGADLSKIYLGGNGDGNDKLDFVGVLNGAELAILYSGGDGDGGHKSVKFSGVIDGTILAQLYRGGSNDGHDKETTVVFLNGDLLSQLYSGGNGDGADKFVHSGILDGTPLSALYSGGGGDGFSKNKIQYIFDFPDCTFVVNNADDGFGSLRYAINCASAGDTIQFSPLLLNDDIQLNSGPLLISQDLYINANPSANLTVDGSLMTNSFLTGMNGVADITITGLNIISGTDPFGGAIINGSTLTLENLNIIESTNNSATVIASFNGGTLIIKGNLQLLHN